MFISTILHSADGTVGFMQAVHALHDITIAALMLVLVVTSVVILHFVLKLVFRMTLKYKKLVRLDSESFLGQNFCKLISHTATALITSLLYVYFCSYFL